MSIATERFRQAGFRFLPRLIPASERPALETWARSMDAAATEADDQVAGAPAVYASPVTEFLLGKFAPAVEETTGCAVFPTYSYLRIYKTGSSLARHNYRPACQFTLSLALGCDSALPWPIGLETAAGPRSFTMATGDALLFRGCDLPHWRDTFEGIYCAQAFLHYVNQDGPNAGEKFDGRRAIGAPKAGCRETNAG